MLKRGLKVLFTLFIIGNSNVSIAQETNLESGKEYILADVEVTGKVSYNEQTVVTFSGLEKGQSIMVPGEEISVAIKKLWKLGLFSDVNFYINKIQGDSIFLELNLILTPDNIIDKPVQCGNLKMLCLHEERLVCISNIKS